MKCPRCGSEVKEGLKYCGKCGGRMDGFAQPARSAAPAPSHAAPVQAVDRFSLDKYLFNQKLINIRETYKVFDENQNELFYVRRLLMALKRHIYVYNNTAMESPILNILQDNIFMILYMRFTVTTPDGKVIAKFRRRNLISALRRTWDIQSPEGTVVGRAVEDSWGKALLRRFVPFGELFKTDFIITIGNRVIGKFIRRWTMADKYILDLTEDPQKTFDRRAAIALAVLLDAGERR